MDVEKLIEEIRKFPVLYDQSSEKYRNADYKEQIWKKIATIMEGDVQECKKRWASIRDQLRRTLQKRKTKSGQAAAKIIKYKYEDILTFLIPYLGERDGLTNVPQLEENDDDSQFSDDIQDVFSPETNQDGYGGNAEEQETAEENETIAVTASTSKNTPMRSKELPSLIKNPMPANKFNFATPSAPKKKIPGCERKQDISPASQLMAYILAQKQAQKEKSSRSETCTIDPVDAFLGGIAPTLKTLDPFLLNKAKGKIFAIVQEYEMKQLQLVRPDRYVIPNYSTFNYPSSSMSPQSSSSSTSPQNTLPNYSGADPAHIANPNLFNL